MNSYGIKLHRTHSLRIFIIDKIFKWGGVIRRMVRFLFKSLKRSHNGLRILGRHSRGSSRESIFLKRTWIPAFAGMTYRMGSDGTEEVKNLSSACPV